jgi:hypothetical protein
MYCGQAPLGFARSPLSFIVLLLSHVVLEIEMTSRLFLLSVAALLLISATASALILIGRGNDPVHDNNWPAGSLELANLKTRVGWWEGPPFGGGQHNFLYRGDTAAFQAALDLFAKIKTPELRLVVHEGPHHNQFLKEPKDRKSDDRVDWTFTVWNPQSWNRLYNNPNSTFSAQDPNGGFRNSVDPPRLDVFIGGAPQNQGVDWKQVKVPPNVKVEDERASANGYAPGTGSVVRGDIFDMTTSKPVSGAKLLLEKSGGGEEAITANADGHFEKSGIAEGSYTVVAQGEGYAPRMVGYASFGKDTLRQYTIRLCPPGSIKGRLIDTDGKPVANATVRADNLMAVDGKGYLPPNKPEVTTDAEGRFELKNLPRGFCQPFAYGKTFYMVEPLKLQAVPADDVTIKMTLTGSIKLKVAKGDGAPPKENWAWRLEPEGGSKIGSYGGSGNFEQDGTYTLENVPPGKYIVTAQPNPGPAAGLNNAQTIEVKGGVAVDVKFEAK